MWGGVLLVHWWGVSSSNSNPMGVITMPIELNLVESACQGDTEALESLLSECRPSVVRFAGKYCATPQDIEDAVQHTLWVVYQQIGRLQSSKAFISWVFTVVRHYCYQLLKATRYVESLEFGHFESLEAPESDNLPPHLHQALATAIAHLPRPYREVLILRDIQGYSASETAHILDITVPTVKSRLHRARNSLRDALQPLAQELA